MLSNNPKLFTASKALTSDVKKYRTERVPFC